MNGPLEIAFDMIESALLHDGTIILGVYEAPLSTKSQDQNVSSIALAIASQIRQQYSIDPLIIEFETVTKQKQVNEQT